MTRWLGPALLSEGKTDDRFLTKVIERTLEEVCASDVAEQVDVYPVIPMRARRGPSGIPAMIAEARRNVGAYNIAFFHRDQGADPGRVGREWVDPMKAAWEADGSLNAPLVPLLPVRESEAWALADQEALRVNWTRDRFGLPDEVKDVEKIRDPKRILSEISTSVSGREVDYYARLGELVALEELSAVPAYAGWRRDVLRVIFDDLGFGHV